MLGEMKRSSEGVDKAVSSASEGKTLLLQPGKDERLTGADNVLKGLRNAFMKGRHVASC